MSRAVSGSFKNWQPIVASGMHSTVSMYLTSHSTLVYEHPLVAPYATRSEPFGVDNPIASLLGHVSLFFESRWTCASDPLDKACSAQVIAP